MKTHCKALQQQQQHQFRWQPMRFASSSGGDSTRGEAEGVAEFMADAVTWKLGEIGAQLAEEVQHAQNKKMVAEMYVNLLNEWSNDAAEVKEGSASTSNDRKVIENKSQQSLTLSQSERQRVSERLQRLLGELNYSDTETSTSLASASPSVDQPFVREWMFHPGLESFRRQTQRHGRQMLHQPITGSEATAAAWEVLRSNGRGLKPKDAAVLRVVAHESNLHVRDELVVMLNMLLRNLGKWSWKNGFKRGAAGGKKESPPPLVACLQYRRIADKVRLYHTGEMTTQVFLTIIGKRWCNFLYSSAPTWERVKMHVDGNKVHPDCISKQAADANFEDEYEHDLLNTDKEAERFWGEMTCKHKMAGIADHGGIVSVAATYGGGREEAVPPSIKNAAMKKSTGPGAFLGAANLKSVAALREYERVMPSHTGRPMGVVSTDIHRLSASIPHGLVLSILNDIGMPTMWIAFFTEFISNWSIAMPDGRVVQPTPGTGMLFNQPVSDFLLELVMYVLDMEMGSKGFPLLRCVDDMIFCARGADKLQEGWRLFVDTLAKLGLKPNMDKTTAAFLAGDAAVNKKEAEGVSNAELRSILTERKLKLHGVVLTDEGWGVDASTVDRLTGGPLHFNEKQDSVFRLVRHYNKILQGVRDQLGPVCRLLGLGHAKQVAAAMVDAEQRLCGGDALMTATEMVDYSAVTNRTNLWQIVAPAIHNPPIAQVLKTELTQRFDLSREQQDCLTRGFFFWSLSAGGVDADHAAMRAYLQAREFDKLPLADYTKNENLIPGVSLAATNYFAKLTEKESDDAKIRAENRAKFDHYLRWRRTVMTKKEMRKLYKSYTADSRDNTLFSCAKRKRHEIRYDLPKMLRDEARRVLNELSQYEMKVKNNDEKIKQKLKELKELKTPGASFRKRNPEEDEDELALKALREEHAQLKNEYQRKMHEFPFRNMSEFEFLLETERIMLERVDVYSNNIHSLANDDLNECTAATAVNKAFDDTADNETLIEASMRRTIEQMTASNGAAEKAYRQHIMVTYGVDMHAAFGSLRMLPDTLAPRLLIDALRREDFTNRVYINHWLMKKGTEEQ